MTKCTPRFCNPLITAHEEKRAILARFSRNARNVAQVLRNSKRAFRHTALIPASPSLLFIVKGITNGRGKMNATRTEGLAPLFFVISFRRYVFLFDVCVCNDVSREDKDTAVCWEVIFGINSRSNSKSASPTRLKRSFSSGSQVN